MGKNAQIQLNRFFKFLRFLEEEKTKAMTDAGRGFA